MLPWLGLLDSRWHGASGLKSVGSRQPGESMRSTAIAIALIAASTAAAQDHDHAGATDKLGKVTFEISCAAGTQPKFERAVAMLHSFWFEQADAAFADVIKSDSTCAMGYWGRAMTAMGNPMARVAPAPARLATGLGYAQKAKDLSAKASHREQMYADAALAFYKDYSEIG